MTWKNSVKILIFGWLVLQLTGCGDNAKETTKATPPLTPEATQAPAMSTPPAPAKYAVTAETRQTYQWYCTQCHGLKGKGDGVNAKLLTVPPRDHTKGDYLETRTDKQLFDAIKLGGLAVGRAPCMPSWGHTLDEEMMHSLVRYIRELCECEAF
jgi:mono/diheme cytochrome c family protein